MTDHATDHAPQTPEPITRRSHRSRPTTKPQVRTDHAPTTTDHAPSDHALPPLYKGGADATPPQNTPEPPHRPSGPGSSRRYLKGPVTSWGTCGGVR